MNRNLYKNGNSYSTLKAPFGLIFLLLLIISEEGEDGCTHCPLHIICVIICHLFSIFLQANALVLVFIC